MQEVVAKNSVKKPANSVPKKESTEGSSEDESDSSSDDEVSGLDLIWADNLRISKFWFGQ